ncbi:glycosyltransferase family 2 protein [Clostridium akagii]|uniref:glycosyltransferase family 2 protein n=1 Tax=Clostridium akagii TaxID=91623 RepID=UPI00068B7CB1|nr:glycosyltransferase family 2 protein [Clostridium akagii]
MNQKISIVTVTFNCKDNIEATIQSVINQTYNDFEYVIVDGISKDGTLEIIKKFCENDKRINYISENDNGIYDAMNKGISITTGDYIIFLNAGDLLNDDYVLEEISNYCNNINDVIFGNITIYNKNTSYKKVINNNIFEENINLIRKKMICHQALICKRELFYQLGKFNLKYKIAADYEWLVNCYINNKKFHYISIIISKYDDDGVSSSFENLRTLLAEYEEITLKSFGKLAFIQIKLKNIYSYIVECGKRVM